VSRDLAGGQIVAGRYRLERCIGRGGMGVVWAATHVVTRREYALKVMLEGAGSEDGRRRLEREARAATAVRHPNVIVVHDVLALDDGTPVMVMDLLEGESLAQRLARDGALPVDTFARLMLPVVSALGAAHAVGIVHRDLKPANIFLATGAGGPGGTVDVKVLDFGIAKLTASEGDAAATAALTNTGTILGTPSYMSPEQVLGETDIDHRADLWALGCIFYESLAGQRPTSADTVGKVLRIILTGSIKPIREVAPGLPDDIASLVTRMLSFSRENRPDDLREVLEVLRAHTSVEVPGFGGASRPPPGLDSVVRIEVPRLPGLPQLAVTVVESPSPRTLRRRRARRSLVIAIGAVVAVAMAAVAAAKLRSSQAPSPGARPTAHEVPSGRCSHGMVEIAGGTFHMGTDDGKEEERPVHEVTLPTFCLGVTEVTVHEYNGCVATGSCTPASRTVYWGGIDAETIKNGFCDAYENDFQDAPLNCVTWVQAERYCRAHDARLPTEEEWEYAARNGSAEDPWPWGNAPLTPSRANLCDDKCAAAYASRGSRQDPLMPGSDGVTFTATVGSYPAGASKAGVLDLVGNVWEWTATPFCRYPQRDCETDEKVFRGGGWSTTLPLNARPTTRLDSAPDHRYEDVGFRCARDVP
jgi:formylglycine-generating enzyme required for sulfatase activity